jgi:predicted transcriptional regulator
MPRSENTFSPQTNLPIELRPRLEALAAHRGQSISAAIGDAVRDAILQFEGGNTKDAKLDRIAAQLDAFQRTLELLHIEKWSQMAPPDGRVNVGIKLDDTDLERVLQAIASEVRTRSRDGVGG